METGASRLSRIEMGYYTSFELRILEGDADLDAVKQRLDEIMEMTGNESCFEIVDDVVRSGDLLKWYDHDAECAEMSKSFPGVVFELHGDGTGSGDIWNAYYKDGKCQICRAQITFSDYDVQKLTSVHDAQIADQERM